MTKRKRKAKRRAPTPDYNDVSEDSGDNDIDVDFLTTDPNSPFVNMDLIAEYSSPEFRALLTDQDKIEICELLPDHIGLTEEGFFRDEFVRYDMDFKHAIRMYQQDLAAGRYDPDWLRQAAQAMEQRANGDFDKWKEQEFEEFWGQKQKLDARARAGQSGTVKLNRLVEAGLFKEGDVFSYMRTFGRGKGKFTVEKDVQIVEIDGTTVTFAIPPGQLKFARRLAPEEDDNMKAGGKTCAEKAANGIIVEHIAGAPWTGDAEIGKSNTRETVTEDAKVEQHDARTSNAVQDTNDQDTTGGSTAGDFNCSNGPCDTGDAMVAPPSLASSSSSILSAIPPDVNDVILVPITTLQALENKIVAIDGRLGKKVEGNAFKNVRVKRDNQDIGSLFEIREEWYAYKRS